MNAWWSFVVALTAGAAVASNDLTSMRYIDHEAGRNVLTEVMTHFDEVHGCYLVPPKGEVVQLMPEDLSGDKYRLEAPVMLRGCRVTIMHIDQGDAGVWELYYTTEEGVKKASQFYNLSVRGGDIASNDITEEDEEHPTPLTINETVGRNLLVEVMTYFDKVHGCYLVPPKGEVVQLMPEDLSGDKYRLEAPVKLRGCRVTIMHIDQEDAGVWEAYYTTEDAPSEKKASQYYNLIVRPQESTTTSTQIPDFDGGDIASNEISQEAEEHPTPIPVDLTVGRNLLIEVTTHFDKVHGCYLVPPKGKVVQLMPEDLSGDKYRLEVPTTLRGCRVTIMHIDQEDAGVWEAYYTTEDVPSEKKASQYYKFIVRPQVELVNAIPTYVVVSEGNDVHVRLEKATPLHATCELRGPAAGTSSARARRDPHFVHYCGFVVTNVTSADAGIWTIQFGTDTKYEAYVPVTVRERLSSVEKELVWTKNLPLNMSIGPEDAVYCKIENPSGVLVSEGFGPCTIVLDRVRSSHAGLWKATIGTVGRVLTEDHYFSVSVKTAAKAQVSTSVVSEKPWVMLSCKVEGEHEITACKFRDPFGKLLLANQGVGEDRYDFYGIPEDLYSEVGKGQCGVRIRNPVAQEQGVWRCAVQTQQDTYYGFLTVVVPWTDPVTTDETYITGSTLTPEIRSISAVEGEQVTLRCSAQSAIRYCYFRAQNGTVFNVSPGSSDWFEYSGAGLDAGECGIRFPALQQADSGAWSCHVGFHEPRQDEARAPLQLNIQAEMTAEMSRQEPRVVVVRGQVTYQRPLEYCRFVRADGFGFTSENMRPPYENYSDLSRGHCEFRVADATRLMRSPWTVVAKIVGQETELARSTGVATDLPEQSERPRPVRPTRSNYAALWCFVLAMSLSVFLVGIMLGPKRNREWTTSRAAQVRQSFRRHGADNHHPQTKPPMPA